MQSVSFESGLLALLPATLKGVACSCCDKQQSIWHLRSSLLFPVCSLCVLYEIEWENKSEQQLVQYIHFVEQAMNRPFPKDPDGRLRSVDDANRLIASLVTVDKLLVGYERRN